jgi:hypothetical protein
MQAIAHMMNLLACVHEKTFEPILAAEAQQ